MEGSLVAEPVHKTYSNLVQDPNDLVGLIAYSIYKREKLDFVEKHVALHGRQPTSQEMQVLFNLVGMSGQVESLRVRATTLLEEMTEIVLEKVVDQIDTDYRERLVSELKKTKSTTRAVFENVVANIIAAALLTLFVVMLYLGQNDAVPLVGKALGYKMEKVEQPAATKE